MDDRLTAILQEARIIPGLSRHLHAGEVYLVGGALRDLLLGRPPGDFDFATGFDPTPLARNFAAAIGGHCFFLDEGRRQSRIIAGDRTYDFAPLRAADLAGDLRRRDFTINAMALPVYPDGQVGILFDPLHGERDLINRTLRACSSGVFADDPLRVLKGVRHAAVLGFAPEPDTLAKMCKAAALLGRVAAERVRSELVTIFAAPALGAALELLAALEVWREILGPADGSVETGAMLVGRMEAVLAAAASFENSLLAQEYEAGLNRASLLRLAAFLRGYAPSALPARLTALRFGRRARAVLAGLQSLPQETIAEAAHLPDYERGRALWAAQLGSGPVDCLLFAAGMAEGSAAANLACIRPVLRAYLRQAEDGRIPDLLDGDWLRRNLGLGEGRATGVLLSRVRREEIAGRVRNAAEAEAFLRAQWPVIRQEND